MLRAGDGAISWHHCFGGQVKAVARKERAADINDSNRLAISFLLTFPRGLGGKSAPPWQLRRRPNQTTPSVSSSPISICPACSGFSSRRCLLLSVVFKVQCKVVVRV